MDLNDDRPTEGAVVEALLGRRPEGAFEVVVRDEGGNPMVIRCLLYTSPSPRDRSLSRMPSSA